jgi:hypothetical protein
LPVSIFEEYKVFFGFCEKSKKCSTKKIIGHISLDAVSKLLFEINKEQSKLVKLLYDNKRTRNMPVTANLNIKKELRNVFNNSHEVGIFSKLKYDYLVNFMNFKEEGSLNFDPEINALFQWIDRI